jgi:hypothetical protein
MFPANQRKARLLNLPFMTAMVLTCLFLGQAFAVPMVNDPNGFEGILWGSEFPQSDAMKLVEDTGRLKTYEPKSGVFKLGDTSVSSIRFTTVENKLARVTVRYEGKDIHDQILLLLQSRYGRLDRTPGQFSVGPVKFYAWQGFDTEVTLRYETKADRGIIFFESQNLRSIMTENSPTVF